MIAVLGAMNEEVDALIKALDLPQTIQGTAARFYRGTLTGREVVIAKSGVGKVLSALSAAELINTFKPEYILFTGIAGGISSNVNIGDLVVGTGCIQYDFDVSALGFPIGQIPFSDYREIHGDSRLIEAMKNFTSDEYKIHFGRILTGDIFVTDKNEPVRKNRLEELQGIAVEMEGASVALTAAVYKIPSLILRFISDKADGSAPSNFQDFLADASRHSVELVRYLINKV